MVADRPTVAWVRWITSPRKRLGSLQRILSRAVAPAGLDAVAEGGVGDHQAVQEAEEVEVERDERVLGRGSVRVSRWCSR